jgi:hypothetical protein
MRTLVSAAIVGNRRSPQVVSEQIVIPAKAHFCQEKMRAARRSLRNGLHETQGFLELQKKQKKTSAHPQLHWGGNNHRCIKLFSLNFGRSFRDTRQPFSDCM